MGNNLLNCLREDVESLQRERQSVQRKLQEVGSQDKVDNQEWQKLVDRDYELRNQIRTLQSRMGKIVKVRMENRKYA